jgi:cell division septation protein DedD
VLGFDPESGTLAVIDASGNPGRVDLRFGEATIATRAKLASLTSANGTDIYGVDSRGIVARLTRSSDWAFTPPSPARSVFPQLDGSLVIVAQRGAEAVAWRLRPPVTKLLDSVALPIALKGVRAQVGDRIYFGTDTGLVGIKVRDLSLVPTILFSERVSALAPTPSGDRVYVTTANQHGVSVIDRYTDRVSDKIDLPGLVADIRMDPLGRYVIAKPAHGDSAWVIAVATDRVIGTIRTKWTSDLPAVAQDGAIAASNGQDVLFLDGETLQAVRTVAGGAKDYWYFMFWNGFRPRKSGAEAPVLASADTAPADTGAATDSTAMSPISEPSTTPALPRTHTPDSSVQVRSPGAPPTPTPAKSSAQTFTVSFAALLSEEKARELASTVVVNGVKARVVPSQRAGTTVYRVVLGPYPNRAVAEQVGRDSQRQYWVYSGEP